MPNPIPMSIKGNLTLLQQNLKLLHHFIVIGCVIQGDLTNLKMLSTNMQSSSGSLLGVQTPDDQEYEGNALQDIFQSAGLVSQ